MTDLIHGSRATYWRHKCRCDACVDAYRIERRAWEATPKGQARAQRKDLKRKYGLTIADVERLVLAQEGRCALCDQPRATLVVDHDHATGRVRGLLCRPCNAALGRWGDNEEGLLRVLDYLRP